MLDIKKAKKFLKSTSGKGWFTLVDIVYDNCPEEIVITEVFQKYGGLEVRHEGNNKDFEFLVSNLHVVSQKMCEICGQSGGYSMIDNWDTTLCNLHYDKSTAKNKYRRANS